MPRKATKKTTKGRTSRGKSGSKRRTTSSSRQKRSGGQTATKRSSRSQARRTTASARARGTRQTASRSDAVAVLKEDHQRLRQLLTRLHDADTPSQRERALGEVRAEIERHTKIEEEIFYPAFRNAARTDRDRELFHEATEEHHAASMVLNEITVTAEPEVFAARAKVLKDVVEHHAEEEESEMFPRARTLMPREELTRLGQELAERKRSLSRDESGGALQAVASLVRMPFSS